MVETIELVPRQSRLFIKRQRMRLMTPQGQDLQSDPERKPRGRPPTFLPEERIRLLEFIRLHGARGAREISGRQVSVATLLKIAREAGLQFQKGRRPYEPRDVPLPEER